MNVVIYARYSSHNQTEQSIEGQLKECNAYAKKNNFDVVGEYIDRAVSGTTDNRPQFLKMIEDSKKKQFNGVIVYQLDRFARDRFDSAYYKRELKKNSVRVFSAKENISDEPSGILMESVLEGMAEYYSKELGQKVKRGMQLNAEKCYYNGGSVPLGLRLVEDDKISLADGKHIIKYKFAIDEEKAPFVVKIFKMYINGSTMFEIIRYLNSQDIKTSLGNEFNKNSIRTILLNKKYIGIYTYDGKDTKDGIPRIIDDNTFEKVQEIMFKNKKAPARARAKTEYLLTTKLFCGYCKELMVGYSGTSHTGKLHNYYKCNNAIKKKCDKKAIQKNYIEDIVVNKAREILTDKNINKIASTVVNLADKEKNSSDLTRLNKLLKENMKRKENLIKAVSECDIESVRKSLYTELSNIDSKNKELEKQIIQEEAQYVKLTVPQIKFFLNQIKKSDINDKTYRKMLINVLVNSVYLYDDKLIIVFNTQNKSIELEISLINEIESSHKGRNGRPFKY